MEQMRILRPKEVARLLGVTVRQISKLDAKGGFAPKVKLGSKSVGYDLRDLEAWIERKKEVA